MSDTKLQALEERIKKLEASAVPAEKKEKKKRVVKESDYMKFCKERREYFKKNNLHDKLTMVETTKVIAKEWADHKTKTSKDNKDNSFF